MLIILLFGGIIMSTVWILRSCRRIYNYEYISYHEFKFYQEKKIKDMREVGEESVLNS